MKKTVTVALDIGNVCVTLQPERALRALGLSRGTLPEEFTDAFCELECGRMEAAEWLSIFRRATGNRFTETELLNIWNSIIGDPMPGMEERVRNYTAKGVKFVYPMSHGYIWTMSAAFSRSPISSPTGYTVLKRACASRISPSTNCSNPVTAFRIFILTTNSATWRRRGHAAGMRSGSSVRISWTPLETLYDSSGNRRTYRTVFH